MASLRIPRPAVWALAALVVALPTALGLADSSSPPCQGVDAAAYRCTSANLVKHRHTDNYRVFVDPDQSGQDLQIAVGDARENWNSGLDGNTTVTLPSVDTSANADVYVSKGDVASNARVVILNTAYHPDQHSPPLTAMVTFNNSYIQGMPTGEKQGRACQAFGQVLGLDKAAGPRGDCMSDPVANHLVHDTSLGLVEDFYGPSVDFFGSLYTNGDLIKRDGTPYTFTATASGHAIESLTVDLVDTDDQYPVHPTIEIASKEQTTSCDEWCTLSASADPADLTDLDAGQYEVRATATNEFGHSLPPKTFTVSVDYPFFGFNEAWQNQSTDPNPSKNPFELAKGAGVSIARYGISWRAVGVGGSDVTGACEDRDGDWDQYDNAYLHLTGSAACTSQPQDSNSVIPFPHVISAPTEHREDTCPGSGADTSDAPGIAQIVDNGSFTAWQHFVQNVALRYPLLGGIEVWNEPNIPKFWGDCDIRNVDEVRYTKLLKYAYDGATASNPDIPVVTGGLANADAGNAADDAAAGITADKNGIDADTYLDRILAPGPNGFPAGENSTAIGLHPYWTEHDCSAPRSPQVSAAERVREARATAGEEPIWVTELGVSTTYNATTDECRSPEPPTPENQEAQQSTGLVDIYTTLRDLAKPAPVVIVHRLIDVDDAPAEWLNGTGVLTPNDSGGYTKKKAYSCLAAERGRGTCS